MRRPAEAEARGAGRCRGRWRRRRWAVGRQKGLAAVLVGQKRIVLLDLEEDECDEDE